MRLCKRGDVSNASDAAPQPPGACGLGTITFDSDASAFGALRLAPSELARGMRIAAAVQWYAQGIVSQGKAAELAKLTRADFLEELHRRKVPACQVTADELVDEIHGA
jgi:predicted HTH domain antitoxin